MEQRTMEIVLMYYRKKYGLKQEHICNGICSVTTLSRLEQGYREIDSLMGELLLGRIGKEVTLFETMLNDEDYDLWKTRDEIKGLVEKRELDKAQTQIDKYRKIMPHNEKIHEQFCLHQEALLLKQKNEFPAMLKTLKKAISITIPCFASLDGTKRLYNATEIEIILLLLKHGNTENDRAEKTLLSLLEYVNQYYSEQKKKQVGTEICMKLTDYVKDSPKKIMKYTKQAINFIGRGDGYWFLAELYFKNAIAVEQYYSHREEWTVYQKKCFRDCQMAYYLFENEEKKEKQLEVQEFCGEKLKCQITEQGMFYD